MDNTFPNQKTQLMWSWSWCNFAAPSIGMENQMTSIGTTGPLFPDHSCRPQFFPSYDLLEEIWLIGSSLNQVIGSTMFLFSGSRSCGTNFSKTHFMPRSCIKILDTVVFGIPRSASSSHTVSCWSLLISAHTHSMLLVAEHQSLSTDSWPFLKCVCTTLLFMQDSLHCLQKPSVSSE